MIHHQIYRYNLYIKYHKHIGFDKHELYNRKNKGNPVKEHLFAGTHMLPQTRMSEQANYCEEDKMEAKKVSRKLLTRLPMYLDYLKSLPEDTVNISATSLANALGLGDVLVRKDLAKVSNGGRCKLGYSRQQLMKDIEDFLDINSRTGAIIVGAGKLGQALLDYAGFEASGMSILAGFDIKPPRKRSVSGKPIYTMEKMADFCKKNKIYIGIITVPAGEAQTVCDSLISCGIEAVWNFAPTHLVVPDEVVLQNENLAVSLTALRLQLKRQTDQKSGAGEGK